MGGEPLLRLIRDRQPWRQVRFWLYDLAREIGAAEKDGTLPPVLALDRVWIAGDGRAKLLDFPAPGLATAEPHQAGAMPAAPPLPDTGRTQRFLGKVAVAALEGRADADVKNAVEAAVPLPLHARNFLKNLPRPAPTSGPVRSVSAPGAPSPADAVAAALQPLLKRPTAVSRLRRAVVVAGCVVFPLFAGLSSVVSMAMLQHSYPGIFELSMLLQARQGNYLPAEKKGEADTAGQGEKASPERQVAVFIASHYRATIADDALWNSPIAISMIKGDARQFAEQSLVDYPAPTKEEIAAADAALNPWLQQMLQISRPHPLFIVTVVLIIYVCLPALIAALLFRGGLVLLPAGINFVRRDGKRASRLRVFWRALVAWCPLLFGLIGFMLMFGKLDNGMFNDLPFVLNFGLYCGLAVLSVALPQRGLPDRLAGTWPVPR